jgi:hypothetical protein
VEVRTIRWHELWPRADALGKAHHLERGFPENEYAVDGLEMQAMDLAGRLLIVALFAPAPSAPLEGYLIWYLAPQFGAKGVLLGNMGPWYVQPARRGGRVARVMWDHSLAELRLRGVHRIMAHSKPAGAAWLRRSGAEPYELHWLMEL